MGQALSDKQTLQFDLSNGNNSGPFEFDQWGTITTCQTLPGPSNYNLKQCAVVINKVICEKLRFFVYDERFDELLEIYQTTSNVQQTYNSICALLTSGQPSNLNQSLKALFGRAIKGVSRSYKLCHVQTRYGEIINQSLLCSGDLIARGMATSCHIPLPSWHYGVYFDNHKVYHWHSPSNKKSKTKGRFMRTSLREFMGTEKQLYVEYDVIQIRNAENKERRAMNLLDSRYNLWNNNCEHLANEICRGDSRCDQKWMGLGSIMGSELTFTGMLFNSLGGPSKKSKVKCIECKAWNYDEKSCDANKACRKCKKAWNDYQNELAYEARQKQYRYERDQRESQRQYQNWDRYQRQSQNWDYNRAADLNSMPTMSSYNMSSFN